MPTIRFTQSFTAVRDRHYSQLQHRYRRSQFEERLAAYLHAFRVNARPSGSDAEQWPNRQPATHHDGFECRKIRFTMPGLRGSASKGRLIYLVHEASCQVVVVWVYTHAEFDTRPLDIDLRDAFRSAMDDAMRYVEQYPELELQMPDGESVKGIISLRWDPDEDHPRSS